MHTDVMPTPSLIIIIFFHRELVPDRKLLNEIHSTSTSSRYGTPSPPRERFISANCRRWMIKRYCSRLTFWPRGVSLSLSLFLSFSTFHPSCTRAPRRRYESEFRPGYNIRVGFSIFLSSSRSSITFQYPFRTPRVRDFFLKADDALFQKKKKTSAHTFPKECEE